MNAHIARTIAEGILNFNDEDVLAAQLATMPRIRVVRIRPMHNARNLNQNRPFHNNRTSIQEFKVEGTIDDKCSICLNEFNVGESMVALPCTDTAMPHRFHSGCLKPWFDRNSSCPVCRTQY